MENLYENLTFDIYEVLTVKLSLIVKYISTYDHDQEQIYNQYTCSSSW